MSQISFQEFEQVDIRIGTIIDAEPFPTARKPLFRLHIDFGSAVGIRRSAAGLPPRYAPEELVGRQVIAALNLGTRNIAGFQSECLTLGVPDENGEAIILVPTHRVPDGGKLF